MMHAPVLVRRAFYRLAYAGLTVYWRVSRPTMTGVKCLITDGDRVLLVRHAYGRRAWDLPGGSRKRGESPRAAARREMHEELGVTIDDWLELGQIDLRMNHRADSLHCFHAELAAPALSIDHGELASASWFELDRLPADLSRFVAPLLTRWRLVELRSASNPPA
jgi:8-oxo-dGTP pyrophosphatase MutT (NUDIX family)